MSQDYLNPDETTYDLISRLRKEAKEAPKPSQTSHIPHPSTHGSARRPQTHRGAMPTQNLRRTPHVNFNNKSKGPKQILGMKLTTVLMGISTLFALGILAVGLTILFANQTLGRPRNGSSYNGPHNPSYGNYGSGGEDEDYPSDYYENYLEDYDNQIPGYDDPEPQETEDNPSEPYAFTLQDVTEAIGPPLENLLYELEVTIAPDEWETLLADFALDAYNAYEGIDLLGEDWQIFVTAHAENKFLASEWAAALNSPPEEYNYEEADEYEAETDDAPDEETQEEQPLSTPSPTPESTPQPPAPTPQPPAPTSPPQTAVNPPVEEGPQFVFISLTKIQRNVRTDIVVPFINNQRLIDLFVRDFHLRLAVNNPAVFPFDENAMIEWANTIARLYIENGVNNAENWLRYNIAALEQAEIEQQYR